MKIVFDSGFETSSLSEECEQIAEIIMKAITKALGDESSEKKDVKFSSFGQKVFHEGNSLGYGSEGALLTVIHEGGDHARFLSYDYAYNSGKPAEYEPLESVAKTLIDNGYLIQQSTAYASVVYNATVR